MDNKPVFRMSSAGKCPRALSAQLLGMEGEPTPEFVLRAAEEGNWHEKRIKEQLFEEGYFVHSEQEKVTLEYSSFTLVGHIDGQVTKDGEWSAYTSNKPCPPPQLLEIKTMSQFEFDRWMKGSFKAFPGYADQITCYMEATGLNECLYIVKNRSSGYEDRRVLTEKPSKMFDIVLNLTDAFESAKNEELVKRDFDSQSIECRRCEYKKLCIPEPKELTPIEKDKLEAIIAKYRAGKSLEATAKEIISETREALEQHTKATGVDKWSLNELAIQLVHYNESVTYPKVKLLKAFTEEQLEPASQVKEAFDSLRITDLEKD